MLYYPSDSISYDRLGNGMTDENADRPGKCERGRDEKHDGAREIRRGEREIDRGHVNAGLADIRQGQREQRQGARKECRSGGRC